MIQACFNHLTVIVKLQPDPHKQSVTGAP